MRKSTIGILIACFYCFPFVYFSTHSDFADLLILGFLITIAGISLLAFASKLLSNSIFLIIGNILSIGSSFYFINEMTENEQWHIHFIPLAPFQLLILVSFLNLIPQLLAIKFAKRYRYKFED